MFNALFAMFKKPFAITYLSTITANISEIVELFESEYATDKNAKNAAIDAVIQILEEHKDKNG